MRTFIELKKISLEKEHVETKDFPESGIYILHRKGKVESNDFVFIDKNLPNVIFVCPIDIFNKLNIEVPEEEIICKYNESEEKKHQEKHPALPNFAKADESLKFSQRKINNESLPPTAELISEGMVSADFVLEFTKILLSKK